MDDRSHADHAGWNFKRLLGRFVIQPYYASQGQLARHRTNSIIGMFLAGAVCVTAPEDEKPQERWKLIYEFLGVKKPTFSLFSNV